MANVTVIPASVEKHTSLPVGGNTRRKVAAYARVSTDSDEQLTSYEAQVDYYTQFIRSKAEWQFAGVYTDEGISALNTKKREGFNRMIDDALSGKIDLIVTKSVSRFARNTVDSLTTIRKLKEHGVEVYFEKESIWSFDGKGELLLTIMSSLAQEESRSISDNVTWGQRKRFADGKVSMPFSSFLGYRKGEDGQPEIVPEEAEVVKTIYSMFISGKTVNAIARHLTDSGIPTPRKKKVWQTSTIESILTNEKYMGDARLQKKFTVDFLNKKMKVNEGEVPQYYVTDSHPAIISKKEWDQVQEEMKIRKSKGKHHNSLSPFSAKIICGDCGEYYGSKVWHSTDKYKRTIWQCNGKYKGDKKCETPHITEDELKKLFLESLATLLENRDQVLDDCRTMADYLSDTSAIDEEIEQITDELDMLSAKATRLIEENASTVIDQEEYNRKYDACAHRFSKVQERLDYLKGRKVTLAFEADVIECYAAAIYNLSDFPVDFSDKLFHDYIDHITIYQNDRIVFTFKDKRDIEKLL